MWIKTTMLLCCIITALAIDEHRPKKLKDDSRGKRNLQYSITHHYGIPGQNYRLERRISTGSQLHPQLYHHFPGPRSYTPYHKGRPSYSLPAPPYAVQMEPLVHYSQRDPLYDTNSLSLNTDGHPDDLLTDNNHLSEHVYGPLKQQVIERPVYIKEPEPIIEIIIKESNVTLPPPPAPPTPPPKKKEQVQVFYVKYKKNPNGHGKDSIIYEKPIPAISPPISDEHEEAPPQQYYHQEIVTSPPPPSTTLRTIIRPDSETYHSPSGVKVTFGKESFDYDKRSSKPEELKTAPVPQGRQLSHFPIFNRRPSNFNFNTNPPTVFRTEPPRQPQPYRPFTQFRPQNYPQPNPTQYSTLPKYLTQQQQPQPVKTQQFPPPRPIPPQFSPQRQPVPYQPFENIRPQSQHHFENIRPQQHFENLRPQPQQTIQFRPQTHFPITQKPLVHFTQPSRTQPSKLQQTVPQYQPQPQHINQQIFQSQQQQASIIPPGGQLIQSLPKFEQHISILQPNQSPQQPILQQQQPTNHLSPAEYSEKIQQQIREANALQESIRQSSPYNQPQYFNFPGPGATTPTSTTTYLTTPSTATTTTTTEKPSTTTKDPQILSAQLPDEVPDELRQQLLSSGILNNAQISILDYDKVGDIPLSALPPDQLANFYNAGGGQQIQSSAPIPAVVDSEGDPVDYVPEASERREVVAKPEVQMKVVHYDPKTSQGQQVQKAYVKTDAKQVNPVVLNDGAYNRYLPLKISGSQFPIPDVPELKGKKITSVVVLAPVSYQFAGRQRRGAKIEEIELIKEDALKNLLRSPTLDNFNKFLEKQNQTKSEEQSVILLVTDPSGDNQMKEIYMYDVGTQTVSKLNGELSAAFVEAAEANSSEKIDTKASSSRIVETKVPYSSSNGFITSDVELDQNASELWESRVPIIDPSSSDLETEASEHLNSFVDISGMPVVEDLAASETGTSKTVRLPSFP